MSGIDRSQTNLATSTDGTPNVYAMHNAKPLAGTQINSSTTTRYYNVADERTSLRSSFTDTGTAGDTSQQTRYGEYKVIDSTSIAYNFYGPVGTKQSELFRLRTVSITENTVALPSEQGNLEVGGVNITFEGTRVKSALVGRDLNPIGRGDGVYYYAGAMALGVAPATPGGSGRGIGTGNSVNNCGQMGMMAKPEATRNFDFLSILMMMASIGILNQLYSLMFASLGFGGNNTDILPNIPPKPDFAEEGSIDRSKIKSGGGGGGSASSPCGDKKPSPSDKPYLRAVGCCVKQCCLDEKGKPKAILCGPVDELCCEIDQTYCGRDKVGKAVRSKACCGAKPTKDDPSNKMPMYNLPKHDEMIEDYDGVLYCRYSPSDCDKCPGWDLIRNSIKKFKEQKGFWYNVEGIGLILGVGALFIPGVGLFIGGILIAGSVGGFFTTSNAYNPLIESTCTTNIITLTTTQGSQCSVEAACSCLGCQGTSNCTGGNYILYGDTL